MSASAQASRRARRSRNKGAEGEREVVNLHKAMKVHAERVPLSGAMAYQQNGEDVDVYALGRGQAPLVCQVKRQKWSCPVFMDGHGFARRGGSSFRSLWVRDSRGRNAAGADCTILR